MPVRLVIRGVTNPDLIPFVHTLRTRSSSVAPIAVLNPVLSAAHNSLNGAATKSVRSPILVTKLSHQGDTTALIAAFPAI